jgi:hypothetical protein
MHSVTVTAATTHLSFVRTTSLQQPVFVMVTKCLGFSEQLVYGFMFFHNLHQQWASKDKMFAFHINHFKPSGNY